MRGTLFRRVVFLHTVLLLLGVGACLGTGSLLSNNTTNTTTDSDSTGKLEPHDDPVQGQTSPNLPGPFDPEENHHPSGHPPIVDAEPSVFSTQIGEGHTPQNPEDYCSIEIFLPLEEIAADHDIECHPNPFLHHRVEPRVILDSGDVGLEFHQEYDATCGGKGWEIQIDTEGTFRYSYERLRAVPRTFEMIVEILHDGKWEQVRDFRLSFTCPWPPPEDPPADCGESCDTSGKDN